MNTVQSETRRRCSNTPSLAALAVAAPPPLTPSRPQPYPPPHNARQRNTGNPRGQPPRHNDTTVCRHIDLTCRNLRAHRRRQPHFRRSDCTPLRCRATLGSADVATPHWHKFPAVIRANSLRSGLSATALQSRPAPPLHYGRASTGGAHPRHTPCGIGNHIPI